MLHIEEITKKFPRIYHTIDDINKFAIRIRLIEDTQPENEDIALVKWQQKRFSHEERLRFANPEDCQTDLAKEYHQQIAKETRRGRLPKSRIFTYVTNDDYNPQQQWESPRKSYKTPEKPDDVENLLSRRINQLKLTTSEIEDLERQKNDTFFDYFTFLQGNINNPVISIFDNVETYFIMADFGEYYNDTWLPTNHVLCIVKYDKNRNILEVTPDFTIFEAYTFTVTSDETKTYSYWLENASSTSFSTLLDGNSFDGGKSRQLVDLQQSLKASQIEMEHRHWDLDNKAYVHVSLEILHGENFDNDVFVRYYLGLNDWQVKTFQDNDGKPFEDALTGFTMTSSRKSTSQRHHFNFSVEWEMILSLEKAQLEKPPIVFLEVISKDTWQRYRSEGISQLVLAGLTTKSGRFLHRLQCVRLTSGICNELRRFFVGDCGNYNNLEQFKEVVNGLHTNTIATGALEVAVNVLRVRAGEEVKHFPTFEKLRELRLREKLRDPRLTRTVDDAVEAFKRAREAMVQAREAAEDRNNATMKSMKDGGGKTIELNK